jgi:hypothetical protein
MKIIAPQFTDVENLKCQDDRPGPGAGSSSNLLFLVNFNSPVRVDLSSGI